MVHPCLALLSMMLWSGPVPGAAGKDAARLSAVAAGARIMKWIRQHDATSARSPAAQFRDITPHEVWTRFGCQVFREKGRDTGTESYLVHGDQVIHLGSAFGGNGLLSIVVADLARDRRPEMLYTYSWGSGIHRTELAMLRVVAGRIVVSVAKVAIMNVDARLRKIDDRTIKVFDRKAFLGTIVAKKTPRGYVPDVAWGKSLPAQLRRLAWPNYGSR